MMINSIKKQECSYILLQGIFLISVLFFALFVSSILFMFHISITSINFLLAVLCSVAITFYFSGGSIKKTVITAVVGLLIISVSLFLCMHVYDWSWDGNAYRKARTGLLKYGWNPIYETYFDFAISNNMSFLKSAGIWYDTSPKASEIIAAVFYAITNNVEAAKCYTFISICSLFCISFAFLFETKMLKKWQCVLCSLTAVIYPASLAQSLTYYNDVLLGFMLYLCFIALLYLTFFFNGQYNLLSWYFIFISINIGFNIKLSMPLFLAILCLTFFSYWIYLKLKIYGLYKTFFYYKKTFIFFIISVMSGFFITGSTYYISNYFHYGHPFGGSSAGGIADEITNQMPPAFKNMSYFVRFLCSLFSRTNNNLSLEKLELKLPFSFFSGEIAWAQEPAVRIAGWGIFFSAIFLISIGFILFDLVENKDRTSKFKQVLIILLLIFVISVCIIPGLSWSKYNQVMFWFPVTALILLFDAINCNLKYSHVKSFFAGILVVLLILNIIPNLNKTIALFKEYDVVYTQIEEFKDITEKNNVEVKQQSDFYGRFFNLFDMGITNWVYGDVNPENCTGKLFNNKYIYYNILN